MASLGNLQSQLNYFLGVVSTIQAEIKQQKKRRTEVESVKSSLKTVVNNNSSDVNGRLRKAANELESAIDYSGKDAQLTAILSDKEEKTLGGDNHLSSADGEFDRELRAIEQKIASLEAELGRAQRSADNTRSDIKTEKTRIADEAKNK